MRGHGSNERDAFALVTMAQVLTRHGARAPYARLFCWDAKHHNPMNAEWTCTTTSVSVRVAPPSSQVANLSMWLTLRYFSPRVNHDSSPRTLAMTSPKRGSAACTARRTWAATTSWSATAWSAACSLWAGSSTSRTDCTTATYNVSPTIHMGKAALKSTLAISERLLLGFSAMPTSATARSRSSRPRTCR